MHQIFHCRFLKAKDPRKICINRQFSINLNIHAEAASTKTFFRLRTKCQVKGVIPYIRNCPQHSQRRNIND